MWKGKRTCGREEEKHVEGNKKKKWKGRRRRCRREEAVPESSSPPERVLVQSHRSEVDICVAPLSLVGAATIVAPRRQVWKEKNYRTYR